jgi:predicted nucleic acid-binding protein
VVETVVVDASAAAKWVLVEPGHDDAVRLWDSYAAGEVPLIAPDLLMMELASLLSKQCRRKQISSGVARAALTGLLDSSPELVEARPRIPAAFELSIRFQISLWHAVYFALALEMQCDLITADVRLYNSISRYYPLVRTLS